MNGVNLQKVEIDGLRRFIPEPKGSGAAFHRALEVAGDVAGSVLGKSGFGVSGLDAGLQDLLNRQMELQKQMMLVSMHSNIEKTDHDTRMAPVRNLRVN